MKAFVVMPFENEVANDIYRLSTKPICEEFNLEVQRADEIFTTNPILDDILLAIKEATIIIADISGKNPNVFYELGISHLLKQNQTIMITNDEFEKIPFDISHFRIIKYENSITGKSTYEKQLRLTLRNILIDYKSIYKNEFNFIVNVLNRTETDDALLGLMALAQVDKPIEESVGGEITGHNKNFEMYCTGGSFSLFKNILSIFFLFDMVKITENLILITEKGAAFVDFLQEKGYVLDEAEFR